MMLHLSHRNGQNYWDGGITLLTLTCQGGGHSKVVAKLQGLVALPSKAWVAKTKNKVIQLT